MRELPAHLAALEAEAIHILRDGVAEARKPVVLFSGGKDSTVLAHLVLRTFLPARPPVPLLHIDSTWEFADVLSFRDAFAFRHGFELIVHANEDGRSQGINPFDHGDHYTTVMRTEPLKQALVEEATMSFSAARVATRRRAAPRNASFRCAAPSKAGTPRRSVRNSGDASTGACRRANRSAPSLCPTGPSRICGSTSFCAR